MFSNQSRYHHGGFSAVADQLVSKSLADGFTFNVLCVGETGVGKSTLLSSLFNGRFDWTSRRHDGGGPVTLSSQTHQLKESLVRLQLTLVETVGYGDQLDRQQSYQPIVDYIDDQYEKYFNEELKIDRRMREYQDTRVHLCLYLISPTGHGLRAIDLVTMKQLQDKVNLIPVIAKSDAITKEELQLFRQRVRTQLSDGQIEVYQLPVDDLDTADKNAAMNALSPFAVIASDDFDMVNGRRLRCRTYPWGTVQVENENHSDFLQLRDMIICTNLENLREDTNQVHYERYRRLRLFEMGFSDDADSNNPQSLYASLPHKKDEMIRHIARQLEAADAERMMRVSNTENQFAALEKALVARYEKLKQEEFRFRDQLQTTAIQLEEERSEFTMLRQQFLISTQYGGIASSASKKKTFFDLR